MTQDPPRTTHFGYQEVPVEEKSRKVAEVFHAVASKYDLMNDAMSFGIHRLWKRYAVLQAGLRPGMRVLDLAGGTGDLARQFAPQVGPSGEVVLADINSSMLTEGRRRMVDAGIVGNVRYAQVNAECLPFPAGYFDVVTIAFGLRNVTDKDAALASMRRVLKPGGKLLILEFSKPPNALFSRAYDAYSFTALPLLGKLIAGDGASYRYLAESIRMHPDQETLKAMMAQAGFGRCDYFNLTGGVVALHRGYALD
ncbi:MAG: bifunctional demethylmenaquinone methyltransferase/2-methoxy-6-polyprenyl-1,4-benzoquinol methylase UbiE [Thiotrichales bacterium]